MAALTGPRPIYQQNPDFIGPLDVAADAIIYDGAAIVMSATGFAQPATAATGLVTVGVADLNHWSDVSATGQATVLVDTSNTVVNNTGGADGARKIVARDGVHMFNNKTGDLVTRQQIGLDVYWEDDNTVRLTGTGASVAGKLMGFDSKTGLPMVRLFGDGRAI